MDALQGFSVVDASGYVICGGPILAAIEAAVEDTSVLTANGAYKTGADGWTQILVASGTGTETGTVNVPEGARSAIIAIVNATDVTVAPKLMGPTGETGDITLIAASEVVTTGARHAWAGIAAAAGSAHTVCAMLGALIPGFPLVYTFTAAGRSSGVYTVQIWWGS